MTTVLQVRDLAHRYGKVQVVNGVNFEIAQGEVLTLLGPSGCGKTTILRLVAGLEEPHDGEILLHGRTVAAPREGLFVSAERRNVGLVFQSYAVWPHMTVAENVAYPLEVRRWPRTRIQAKVEEMLHLTGLQDYAARPATALSGGQQQRVSLARALAYEPDILLLDEPLSNLDAQLRQEMRLHLKALQARLGTTILYVTHDQVEAMALSHRVAVMNAGRIAQLGTPADVYEAPASYFVQSFVGQTLTLDGVVERCNGHARIALDGHAMVLLDGAGRPPEGATVRVAVRPEDVRVEPLTDEDGADTLAGILEELVYCGTHYEGAVRVGAKAVTLDIPKPLAVERGQRVALRCEPTKVRTWRT
jgi:iron(III) transport system ATP-binding protein